tara:strand:- start:63 stop:248 length:186 start_codon:yes stop_codon:yes gene_type:complete
MKDNRGVITHDIQTTEGMLHKNTEIVVLEVACTCTHGDQNIKVKDNAGRIFWVGQHDILLS